ncbi:MAG: Sugar transporter STL1 [Lasallia pustulata]|uniref:Sugar transporter STL1 n=1 Tax=Lasallia pustulata TaxID=136370 RepID=A0A5M8Q293_9LECA|nr:MAG: Sugar transporter STL1 [Lasallia pustulata]
MNTFFIPITLSRLGWKIFIMFGCFNIIAMPIIWFIYPEPANKTLEEVNLLFTSDSLLVGKNMADYRRLVDEAGGNITVAERRLLDSIDVGYAETDARTMSYAAHGGEDRFAY